MITDIEYMKIARRIQMMKYIHGAEWVNATLRRHKDLLFALQDYEKTFIIDAESNLIGRSVKDE